MKWTALCLLWATTAHAGDVELDRIYWRPNDNGHEVALHFTGGVKEGDLLRIKSAIIEAAVGNKLVSALWLDSWGGDGDTGIMIADWVYRTKIEVFVDDTCLSACAFAALVALGHGRLVITDKAEIGVHQVITTATGKPDLPWTRMAAEILRKYGAPREPLQLMCDAPSDKMKMLSPSMLAAFGAEVMQQPFKWGWW